MERALRQELRAADLLGLRLEYVDEQRADRLATLGKGEAECPGDVAVPEIAFASRRCNKTGHNQQ
jgi:hypothetical protein